VNEGKWCHLGAVVKKKSFKELSRINLNTQFLKYMIFMEFKIGNVDFLKERKTFRQIHFTFSQKHKIFLYVKKAFHLNKVDLFLEIP
jgi:hypothetical protein